MELGNCVGAPSTRLASWWSNSVRRAIPTIPAASWTTTRMVNMYLSGTGCPFAVAGDPMTTSVAGARGGRVVEVDDPQRPAYHAAATIAANHLVALVGQVERVATSIGLPLDAFADLMRAATDDALALGPRRALPGPASRGDWDTVDRHRRALSSMAGHRTELAAYDAMVGLARRLSMEAAPASDPVVKTGPEPAGGPDGRDAEQVA